MAVEDRIRWICGVYRGLGLVFDYGGVEDWAWGCLERQAGVFEKLVKIS